MGEGGGGGGKFTVLKIGKGNEIGYEKTGTPKMMMMRIFIEETFFTYMYVVFEKDLKD